MRRIIFLVMGILEFVIAGTLLFLSYQLPSTTEVEDGFQRAEHITDKTGTQVRLFRQQVSDLRRPELQSLARRLQKETHSVTAQVRAQPIDYATVQALRDVFDEVSKALNVLSRTLDEEKNGQLRQTLSRLATLLDAARRQLDHTLKHRQEYEATLQQTISLADAIATELPTWTEQFDSQLGEQEQTLDDLGHSIDDMQTTLPAVSQSTVNVFRTVRCLLGLVAAIVALHGAYLVLSVTLGRRFTL